MFLVIARGLWLASSNYEFLRWKLYERWMSWILFSLFTYCLHNFALHNYKSWYGNCYVVLWNIFVILRWPNVAKLEYFYKISFNFTTNFFFEQISTTYILIEILAQKPTFWFWFQFTIQDLISHSSLIRIEFVHGWLWKVIFSLNFHRLYA